MATACGQARKGCRDMTKWPQFISRGGQKFVRTKRGFYRQIHEIKVGDLAGAVQI